MDSSSLFDQRGPRVVATISTVAGWELAKKLSRVAVDCPSGETVRDCLVSLGSPDLLEIRADLLLENALELPSEISDLPLPVLLTVRHPSEGGKGPLDPAQRAEIYRRHWKNAAAIDIELASVSALRDLIDDAISMQLPCVFSHHDFTGAPTLDQLEAMTQAAADAGASCFKVAAKTDTVAQLSTLLTWVESNRQLPVAAMGMGRLGKISRPLLAQLGSQLNYGYLDAPVVPGQWPVSELRRVIASLLP